MWYIDKRQDAESDTNYFRFLQLQFTIVTPDGRLRIANACQNSDLFWALRGGGGGTFGVVLETVHEVIPHPVTLQGFVSGTAFTITLSKRWEPL